MKANVAAESNTRGTAMFNPYTNLTTVEDTELLGNVTSPGGTGMGRNDVTTNFTYQNITIRGFALGVAIPVNGLNLVEGGTFQNKRNFEITTANSRTRTVQFNAARSPNISDRTRKSRERRRLDGTMPL